MIFESLMRDCSNAGVSMAWDASYVVSSRAITIAPTTICSLLLPVDFELLGFSDNFNKQLLT